MVEFIAYDRTPLRVVFWLHGVAASAVLAALVAVAFPRVSTPVLALLLAGVLAYSVWIVRRVWVHAFNVRNPLYGHIARALTVAWALNAALLSVFVLLAHVERGLGLPG